MTIAVVAVVVTVGAYVVNEQHKARLAKEQSDQLDRIVAHVASDAHLTQQQVDALKAANDPRLSERLTNLTLHEKEWQRIREENSKLQQEASERESQAAVARAWVTQRRSQMLQTRERLRALVSERVNWQTHYLPLLTNDPGRRIAASTAHLELGLAALRRERASDAQVETWSYQVDMLIVPLQAAFDRRDADAVVTGDHERLVTSLSDDVWQELDRLRRDKLVLDSLIAETASFAPATQTIQDVIKSRELDEAKQQLQRLEKARQEALSARTAVIEKKEGEKLAAETQVRLQQVSTQISQLQAEQEDLKAQSTAAERRRVESLAKAELEKQFDADWPRIRGLLVPFTAAGVTYRLPTLGRGPMSLSAIRSSDALRTDKYGVERLAVILRTNDRPLEQLPKYARTSGDIETLSRVQRALSKYGTILVDRGLLAD